MVIPGKPDFDEDVTRGAPTSWKVRDIGAGAASAAVSERTNEQSVGLGDEQRTSRLAKVTLGDISRLWSVPSGDAQRKMTHGKPHGPMNVTFIKCEEGWPNP